MTYPAFFLVDPSRKPFRLLLGEALGKEGRQEGFRVEATSKWSAYVSGFRPPEASQFPRVLFRSKTGSRSAFLNRPLGFISFPLESLLSGACCRQGKDPWPRLESSLATVSFSVIRNKLFSGTQRGEDRAGDELGGICRRPSA